MPDLPFDALVRVAELLDPGRQRAGTAQHPYFMGGYALPTVSQRMHRPFLAAGSLFALIAVAAGAFGAHGLEGTIPAGRLETFETAARYQMYHALGLFLIGLAAARWPSRAWAGPALLMIAGTVIFSGSLYALALSGIGVFGAIAPIGGAGLIASWGWTAVIVLRAT